MILVANLIPTIPRGYMAKTYNPKSGKILETCWFSPEQVTGVFLKEQLVIQDFQKCLRSNG
jgi:hypothetical protein